MRLGSEVLGISRSKKVSREFTPLGRQYTEEHSKHAFHQLDINTDLCDIIDFINRFKHNIIYNFAAQGMVEPSWTTPSEWYETNFVSSVKLVQYLLQADYLEKFVQISTPEVYGDTGVDLLNENTIYNPSTPYAHSKACFDKHLELVHGQFGFPVVFTRSVNVYGECQQLYRIIPKTILSAKANKKLTLSGGGKSIRSFIHINDVIQATVLIARKANPGTIWHITNEKYTSISDLVKIICHKLGMSYEDLVLLGSERIGNDRSYCLSGKSLRDKLGWSSSIDLHEGIDYVINWIDEYHDVFMNMSWSYEHKK